MNTVRCETQKLSGTKKGISKRQSTELERNSRCKNITDLYKSINEFNNGHQPSIYLIRAENGKRVCSIINVLWSDEKKNKLKIERVKATLKVSLVQNSFPKYRMKKCFWNRFTNLIYIQVNLGRLSQSKTYILFLYEFF
jgi:transcriptional regulator